MNIEFIWAYQLPLKGRRPTVKKNNFYQNDAIIKHNQIKYNLCFCLC